MILSSKANTPGSQSLTDIQRKFSEASIAVSADGTSRRRGAHLLFVKSMNADLKTLSMAGLSEEVLDYKAPRLVIFLW